MPADLHSLVKPHTHRAVVTFSAVRKTFAGEIRLINVCCDCAAGRRGFAASTQVTGRAEASSGAEGPHHRSGLEQRVRRR